MSAAECHRTGGLHVPMRAVNGRIGISSYGHTPEDVCESPDIGVSGEQQGWEAVAHSTGE